MTKLVLVSDFNVEPLVRTALGMAELELAFVPSSFGQVFQTLLQPKEIDCWGAFVWTTPGGVIPSFGDGLWGQEFDIDACLEEVDRYVAALESFASNHRYVLTSSWGLPTDYLGFGLLDWQERVGVKRVLGAMNERLAEFCQRMPNVFLLDAERWAAGGSRSYSRKLYYLSKVPFDNIVFRQVALDLAGAVAALCGRARRLIVVDLDNTLWGGIIGETGWEGVRLGGHDFIGEAFKDVQRHLKALRCRGVQLAICSKNDESVALAGIDAHPEMILRRDDFVAWRINWDDKAANIVSLAKELRFGLDSIVFLDDSQHERDRVREALPEVIVPSWPQDPTHSVDLLLSLRCFMTSSVGTEDRARTEMYVSERKRRAERIGHESLDDWLNTLKTRLIIQTLSPTTMNRVIQLFNKTNQLNLSTRRMSPSDLDGWLNEGDRLVFSVAGSDRYGDMGLVGVFSLEFQKSVVTMVDFILSCRVMGRRIEEAMLFVAAQQALAKEVRELVLRYRPTERNSPLLNVLRDSCLDESGEGVFRSCNLSEIKLPPSITIANE